MLFAFVCAVFSYDAARWLCVLAMCCSFAGDVFLLDIKTLRKKLPNYFVCGAAAFGLAHICYGAAYFCLLKNEAGWSGEWNSGTKAAGVVIIGLWIYFISSCICKKKWNYLLIASIYILLIGIEFIMVMTYAGETLHRNKGALGAALGALFFLMSDCCLGMGRIVGNHRFDKLVWIFYPLGQFLLILHV